MPYDLSLSDLSNIAVIATAVAAFITFALHSHQVKAQSKAADLHSLLTIMGDINKAWEKLITGTPGHWDFHFGQLLSAYEIACYLSNRKIIGAAAQEPLKDHMVEVILLLVKEDTYLSKMKELSSGKNTYEEIIKFSKKHKNDFRDHWTHIQQAGLGGSEDAPPANT